MLSLSTNDFLEMLFYVFNVDKLNVDIVLEALTYVHKRTCVDHTSVWHDYYIIKSDAKALKKYCIKNKREFLFEETDEGTYLVIKDVFRKLLYNIVRSDKQKELAAYILEYKLLQEDKRVPVGSIYVYDAETEEINRLYLTKQGLQRENEERVSETVTTEHLVDWVELLCNPFDYETYRIKPYNLGSSVWVCEMRVDVYDGLTVTLNGLGYDAETALRSCKTNFKYLHLYYGKAFKEDGTAVGG